MDPCLVEREAPLERARPHGLVEHVAAREVQHAAVELQEGDNSTKNFHAKFAGFFAIVVKQLREVMSSRKSVTFLLGSEQVNKAGSRTPIICQ